jgi:hypothetical protein
VIANYSIHVPPSDNPTANVVAIQSALDNYARVVLNGAYRTNKTIVVPEWSCLEGESLTRIGRFGVTPKDEYTVKVVGPRSGCPLTNLTIDGSDVCRGVLWDRCDNTRLYDSLYVMEALGVSADFVDCWASGGSDLRIKNGKGIAVRMWRCNSSLWSTMSVWLHWCFRNADNAQNVATWDTACDKGQAEARKLPGYAEDWPDPEDASVVDGSGTAVRTPETSRAAIVIGHPSGRQDLTQIDNLMCESVMTGEYPVIHAMSSTTKINTMRLEAGRHADAIVRVVGDGAKMGTHVQFDNVSMDSVKHAKTFMDLSGVTRFCSVSNLQAHAGQLQSSVLRVSSGKHYAPLVERCFVPRISDSLIEVTGGAIYP